MRESVEKIILGGLVSSQQFIDKTYPFLKSEYFHNASERAVFDTIREYIGTYSSFPKKPALLVELNSIESRSSDDVRLIVDDIYNINISELDFSWLLKQAEEFCQGKAIYNAIMQSISIYDGSDSSHTTHSIPDIMKDALGISFDTHIGLDLFDDAEARFDYYNIPENKIPFDIDILNTITNGGCARKTLNLIMAGLNVGKTMSLIHLAATYLRAGYNVLYITMEMSEYAIMQRVDANILQVSVNDIKSIGKESYLNKFVRLKEKTHGKLKVKEFPTGTASSAHFKHLISELKIKQRFVPDIIMVDYLGIMASSRVKMGQQNSYFYLKAVAEELRALAVETDTIIWSAGQLNRGGIASSDVEVTDISDSMGIGHTADFMLGLTRTEDLDKEGQLLAKQLKNRYGSKVTNLRFVIGVDLDKQTLYGLDDGEEKKNIMQSNTNIKTTNPKDRFGQLKV